jgi:Mrp family chromosome partitioning ATPase
MFVVRWADTSGATARVALKQIEMAGVEVRGAVLTMVDPSKHARYGFKDGVYYSKRLRDYGRRSKLVEDTSPNQVEVSL